ncbi:hypothetical protein WMY93_024870 [Mugilogobius chulae]|uniref:RFX1 transcription activation region domain-containing protein n=1 Tax=Mugilogobius chulae TaxID=88201 RepID=A0AAW0NBA8_9GOBI
MQSSEGGSDSANSVATLRTTSSAKLRWFSLSRPHSRYERSTTISTTAQTPNEAVEDSSTTRVLVQATGSAQKGGVQQHSRAQQVPQQVQQVQHVYPSQVSMWEKVEMHRTAYSYNPDSQLYGQGTGGPYFDSQAGGHM